MCALTTTQALGKSTGHSLVDIVGLGSLFAQVSFRRLFSPFARPKFDCQSRFVRMRILLSRNKNAKCVVSVVRSVVVLSACDWISLCVSGYDGAFQRRLDLVRAVHVSSTRTPRVVGFRNLGACGRYCADLSLLNCRAQAC